MPFFFFFFGGPTWRRNLTRSLVLRVNQEIQENLTKNEFLACIALCTVNSHVYFLFVYIYGTNKHSPL